MKIFLADDHVLFRDALIQFIRGLHPTWHIDTGSCLDDAMIAAEQKSYNIILLDLRMPGMVRLEGLAKMKTQYPDQKIAIITGVAEDHHVKEALKLGVDGYLPKTLSGKVIAQAIHLIVNSDHVFIPMNKEGTKIMPAYKDDFNAFPTTEKTGPTPAYDTLSKREKEVALLLAQGLSNKDIAEELGIKPATVKLHVGNICKKLQTSNRTKAAIMMHEYGIISKML